VGWQVWRLNYELSASASFLDAAVVVDGVNKMKGLPESPPVLLEEANPKRNGKSPGSRAKRNKNSGQRGPGDQPAGVERGVNGGREESEAGASGRAAGARPAEQAEQDFSQAKRDAESLSSQLQDALHRIKGLEEELAVFKATLPHQGDATNKDAAGKEKQLRDEIKRLKAALKGLSGAKDALEGDASSGTEANVATEKALQDALARLAEVKKELDTLKTRLREAEKAAQSAQHSRELAEGRSGRQDDDAGVRSTPNSQPPMTPTADTDPFRALETEAVTREKERRDCLSKQFDEIDNEMDKLTDKMAIKNKKKQKTRPVDLGSCSVEDDEATNKLLRDELEQMKQDKQMHDNQIEKMSGELRCAEQWQRVTTRRFMTVVLIVWLLATVKWVSLHLLRPVLN